MTEPTSNERIDRDLSEYQKLGVLDYLLPSDPIGEQWVLGVEGRIVKLTGPGEACAFLAGASTVASFMARRQGWTGSVWRDSAAVRS